MNIAIINNAVYLVKCMAEKMKLKSTSCLTWNRCSTYSVKKRNTDIHETDAAHILSQKEIQTFL